MLTILLALTIAQPPVSIATPRAAPAAATRNVFLIMSDGLRWQEVFTGADERLISKDHGVADEARVRADYWPATPEDRREALMPFVWPPVGDPKTGGQAPSTKGVL